MKFSISLPTGFEGVMYPIPFVEPGDFVRMAQLCERLGYHSVWGNDHIQTQDYVRGLFPGKAPNFYELLTVLSFCARLHSGRVHKLGRLPFLGDAARDALATESRELLETAPGARYVRPGPKGGALAVHPLLMSHVAHRFGGTVTPSNVANYIYYTRPNDYLVPHRDVSEFEINVLLMVERRQPVGGARPSALLVYRPDSDVERIDLEPGEAVAMEARWVIHAREPLADGESLALLTIGCALG